MLLPGPASAATYPPTGTEISSLQEAYSQVNDTDTIRAKNKIFNESLIFSRPITVYLNGGYSDSTYTTTNGFTRLYGTLTVKSGTLKVANLVISGSAASGVSISNVTVTLPRITWNTAQLADSRVDYGETTSYGSTVSSSSQTTGHSLVLTGLKASTTYHYIVSSTTSGASAATADSTFTTPDFIAATVGDIGNSAIIEVSGNYDAKNGDGSLNVTARQTVAKEYFKTHNDTVDFLVMLSTFDYAMPDATTQGFYTAVKNDTLGINQAQFDNSAQFGSNSKLQGTVDMGNATALAANLYGDIFDQTLTVLSHELAHRFGAYVRYKKPDNSLSTALLGKDNAHWSYLLDSQGSVMYGNGWQDNGDGTFTSISKQNAYSQLDLYLLGMIPKEQVPPMLLINNPAIDATKLPFLGDTISGTATTVNINDIVGAEGDRVPSSATSPKQFNIGFILLTRSGDSIGSDTQAIETLRKGFAGRFAELTQGIGSIANVPASLEVFIDTPTDGATITGPSTQVTGTVINTTGVETGVTVNGIPAVVNGGRFIANAVDMLQGTNTITVTATDVNARTTTAAKTVTAQIGNYIRIISNIDSGIAPLDIALSVNGSFTISSSTLNYTGPVAVSLLPGSTPTSYLVHLPVEGTYTLTVQTTGPDGLMYEDSVNITVLPRNRLSWLLKQKWETMKTQVIAGNIPGALSSFTQANRDSFQAVFNDPTIDITSRLNEISSIEVYTIKNDTAQGAAIRQEVDGNYAYPLNFVRDEYGIWCILGF